MEESKFEKQVKEKMDDLKIHPSEAVWVHVKAGIKEKKRSRWLIAFLFVFLIVGSGLIIWSSRQLYVSGYQKDFADKVSNKITNKKIHDTARDTALQANKNILLKKKNNTVVLLNKTMAAKQKHYSLSPDQYRKVFYGSLAKHEIQQEKKEPVINSESRKKNENDIIKIGDGTLGVTTELKQIYNSHKDSLVIESSNDSTSKKNKVNIIANKNNTVHKAVALKHSLNKNKWKLGFVLTSGISSVNNNSLNNNNAAYFNAYGAPATGTNTYYSNSFHPGFGFITGLFAEKKITNKTSLSAGINYVSFTVENTIPDSTLNYAKHIDHFTFLQLPFLIKIKINNSSKIPLLLQGGITLSTLVNTGSLKNKSFYNNIQVGFNSAVSAGLFSIQKHEVFIGPYYYYSVGKLANRGLYYNKHLSFFGLSAEISLNK